MFITFRHLEQDRYFTVSDQLSILKVGQKNLHLLFHILNKTENGVLEIERSSLCMSALHAKRNRKCPSCEDYEAYRSRLVTEEDFYW